MSGFEALGLACNIFQTITFAHDTFIICRAIYNGQQTPDSSVEEKAAAMIKASLQVEASCDNLRTPEEQALADVARKCTITANELNAMVQSITKRQKQGKFFVALGVRLKSLWKKGEMERLEKALADHTSTMQLLLISRIWYVKTDTTTI